MSRPKKCRCVNCEPCASYFKPRGIPLVDLDEVELTLDEVQAICLADYEKLYHEDAAEQMKISRATFGRILEEARHKVADALINGKAVKIESKPKIEGGSK